jgi:hypothetical protein
MGGNNAVRGASLLGCTLLAACCAGCVGSRLDEVAAPGTSLAGTWKLDPSVSDDPQKAIDHMRAEAKAKIARQSQAPVVVVQQPARPGSGHGGAGGAAADSTPEVYDTGTPPPGNGPRPDPLRYSPMYHVLANELARGEYLTVRENPGEFVLDYGNSVRSFTPGAHSVVSAEGGVGDQTSGWEKREYVIRVRAQQGPDVVQVFSLSADGKQLIEKLKIGPAELSQVNLTWVYDRTTEQTPHKLPNAD